MIKWGGHEKRLGDTGPVGAALVFYFMPGLRPQAFIITLLCVKYPDQHGQRSKKVLFSVAIVASEILTLFLRIMGLCRIRSRGLEDTQKVSKYLTGT